MVLSVAGRRHDDRLLLAGQPRDRRHHGQVDRRGVGQDRADHDVAADDQLPRVALGLVDELGEADGAAGAGDVGHLHVAGDAVLLQHRLHGARGLVPAAARRRRRHDRVVGGEGRHAPASPASSAEVTMSASQFSPDGLRGVPLPAMRSAPRPVRASPSRSRAEDLVEASPERQVEVGHRHRQAEVDEARHPVAADAAGHDAGEMPEVGLDVDRDAVEADPAADAHADRGDLVLGRAAVGLRRPVGAHHPDADPARRAARRVTPNAASARITHSSSRQT